MFIAVWGRDFYLVVGFIAGVGIFLVVDFVIGIVFWIRNGLLYDEDLNRKASAGAIVVIGYFFTEIRLRDGNDAIQGPIPADYRECSIGLVVRFCSEN